ncbi:hypothetical protein [Natronospira bacteriovora]|uniref:Uncharacterized protein n=1 Tax=Natronospira bacteriovora TaxID=3069753 RepID=A0ABU0W9W6_9GAMM|nr:hypothetical protein [Natronospira sp. AB-CW4]MDQ2070820.1 hypothetical protein [Natronospira sp. AB-CW4]
MVNTDYPEVFNRLIARHGHGKVRYLELSRKDEMYQLRGLVDSQWKSLVVDQREAARIWTWATDRIASRHAVFGNIQQRERLPAIEIVGRLGGHRQVSRLKLRWRARPVERLASSGTLTMRMKDLAA